MVVKISIIETILTLIQLRRKALTTIALELHNWVKYTNFVIFSQYRSRCGINNRRDLP